MVVVKRLGTREDGRQGTGSKKETGQDIGLGGKNKEGSNDDGGKKGGEAAEQRIQMNRLMYK